jgi:DNA-directed RNA polymerase II subunit RPB1
MQYVAGRIAEILKTDLFVIWNEDNSEKLVIHCRILGSPDQHRRGCFLTTVGEHHAQFCQPSCVEGIKCVFLTQQDSINITEDGNIRVEKGKEWVLEMDSVNLRTVMCVDGVDFMRTYSNSCVEIFNALVMEATRMAIMKELRGVIEFDGSYVNYRPPIVI